MIARFGGTSSISWSRAEQGAEQEYNRNRRECTNIGAKNDKNDSIER